MKSVYKKKPRPNKESSTPGGEKTGPVTKSQPNKKSKKKNFLKGDAEQVSGTNQEVSEVGQNKEGDHTSGKISSSKSVKHKGKKNRNNKKMKKKTHTSVK